MFNSATTLNKADLTIITVLHYGGRELQTLTLTIIPAIKT